MVGQGPGRSFALPPQDTVQLSQGLQCLRWQRPVMNDGVSLKQGGSYVSASAAGSLKEQYKVWKPIIAQLWEELCYAF